MSDNPEPICNLEPDVLRQYMQSFYQTLGAELRANMGSIPCAFGVMLIEPMSLNTVRFNIVTGSVKELLPKGSDEAMAMLEKFLRDWEQMNYPDKIDIGDTVGTA